MAYDERYRTRVAEYILEGHTYDETSGIFKIGKTSIERWLARYRATGTAGGGYAASARPPKKIEPERLTGYMKEHPDAFLKEITREFSCCIEAARKALKRNGFTLKKRRNTTKSAMRRQGLLTWRR